MPEPKLHDTNAEESLIAALLLHEDFEGLEEFTDDEVWGDDNRTIISTVRMLRGANKPCGTVFVLSVLHAQGKLDDYRRGSDTAEPALIALLGAHITDVQSYYGRQLGRVIHYYAEERKALQQAQEAARRTFNETLESHRKRYEGELV
jgi:hypothetical protein